MVLEENLIVVIECRVGVEFAIVDTEIETHVIKDIAGFVVHFQLSRGKSIDEPVEPIVLTNSLVDKLGVFQRNVGDGAELFADTVIFEHFDLRNAKNVSISGITDESNRPTSKGELNIRSPKRIDPRRSGCAFGPPSG